MKKILLGLTAIVGLTIVLAVIAIRMGVLTSEPPAPAPPSPSPRPVVVHSTPSPLPTRDRTVLRIAIDDRASSLPFLALPEFIRNHGNDVHVELVTVADANLRWQMLAAGRVDLACGTLDSFVLGNSRHDAGAILFRVGTGGGTDVLIAVKDIADLHALAGKRVAVVSGSGGSFLMGYFLNRAGLSPSEVKMVEAEDPADAIAMLQNGRVQAAWTWEPHVSKALTNGMHILTSTAQTPNVLEVVCVVNRTTLDVRRPEVLAFMRHWFEFESFLTNNPGLGLDPVSHAAHLPAATVGNLLSGVHWTDLTENQKLENEDIASQMRRVQEFWKITGAQNSGATIDTARSVKIDLTREIEVTNPTSIFGASPVPSSVPSASPSSHASPSVRDAPSAAPSTDPTDD